MALRPATAPSALAARLLFLLLLAPALLWLVA